ncbi:unnamed protein product [Rotaria sp. Silwood1]|nr:unnamed protein product [Rotaria sp. Silwood1]CAF4668130.1 unnamed protein product [Rotaria sp. Silwood1]
MLEVKLRAYANIKNDRQREYKVENTHLLGGDVQLVTNYPNFNDMSPGNGGDASFEQIQNDGENKVDLIINNLTLKTCLPARTSIYNQTGQILVGQNLQNYYWKFRLNRQHSTDLFLDQQRKRLYVTEIDRIIMFDINSLEQGFVILGESSNRLPNLKGMRSSFIDFDDNFIWFWSKQANEGTKLLSSKGDCYRFYVDKKKNIYVTETENHRVVKYYAPVYSNYTIAAGNGIQGSDRSQLNLPFSIYLDEANSDLFVVDQKNRRIQKWSSDAKEGETIVSHLFAKARSVVPDCHGNFIVYSRNEAKLYNRFEITGFDGIEILNSSVKFEAMAYDETNGDIYVLNIKRNNVIKYTIEREVTLYNNTISSLDNETDVTPCEIASDSTWMLIGEVILGNSVLGCGSAKEQLCLPTRLFITSDDILYILDSGNLRIQKYNITDQTVSTAINRGLIFNPLSIYVSETHDIYVLDRPNKTNSFVKVWYNNNYNKHGTILIHANENFRNFYLDQDLNIYILTNSGIRKWFAPNYYYSIGIISFLNNRTPFYIDQQFSLYIYDILQRTINKWSAGSLSSMTVFSGLPYTYNSEQLIFTLDCNNNIYFTHINKLEKISSYVIYRLNPKKNSTEIIDRNLTSVAGVQFDSYGNLYVTERNKHHVKMFAIMN